MAIILSPLFSESRGSMGNVVIYTVKGQVRIRSKSMGHRDKKSPAQLRQREKFKEALNLYRHLNPIFGVAWKEGSQQTTMNACNLFIKENIHNMDAQGVIDPAQLKISIGTLPLPSHWQMTGEGKKDICVNWEFSHNSYTSEQFDDLIQIGVYGKTDKRYQKYIYYLQTTKANRREQQCHLELTPFVGTVHIYACFKSLYTHEYSNSIYLGSKQL